MATQSPRSQHLAWTSDKCVAASVSVCSFTDAHNTVTLPGLFTVCFNRLVLCINNEVFSFKHASLPHSKSQ